MIQVTATVSRTDADGWLSVRQIPTFEISRHGNSMPGVADVVNRIVDPYGDHSVSMMLWDNETNETYSVEV